MSSVLFRKIKIDTIAIHKGILNFPSEHLLFSVQNSTGKLRMNWYTQKKDEAPYEDHYAALLSMLSLSIPTCYPQTKLNEEGLRRLAQDDDYEEAYTAASLLAYAARQPEADVKELAMKFTGQENPDPLRCTAFEILDQIKDDPEVDDLMIQTLVNFERKDDPIYRIADGHWDKNENLLL